MFSLISRPIKQRTIVASARAELSIFDYFKKKTVADVKAATGKKEEVAFTPVEETKKPKKEIAVLPKGNELKKEIKQMER